MLSVKALKDFGADTDQGLNRCMNNEAFYLRLVGMVLEDDRFRQLRAAITAGDLDKGFELTHALKGAAGNLALNPLLEPISEMTELLRSRKQVDYAPLLEQIETQYALLLALAKE